MGELMGDQGATRGAGRIVFALGEADVAPRRIGSGMKRLGHAARRRIVMDPDARQIAKRGLEPRAGGAVKRPPGSGSEKPVRGRGWAPRAHRACPTGDHGLRHAIGLGLLRIVQPPDPGLGARSLLEGLVARAGRGRRRGRAPGARLGLLTGHSAGIGPHQLAPERMADARPGRVRRQSQARTFRRLVSRRVAKDPSGLDRPGAESRVSSASWAHPFTFAAHCPGLRRPGRCQASTKFRCFINGLPFGTSHA